MPLPSGHSGRFSKRWLGEDSLLIVRSVPLNPRKPYSYFCIRMLLSLSSSFQWQQHVRLYSSFPLKALIVSGSWVHHPLLPLVKSATSLGGLLYLR